MQEQALLIRAARSGVPGIKPTKRQNRALREALNIPLDNPDILPFILSGILTRHMNPDLWTQLLSLAPHRHPYSSALSLQMTLNSYLVLLCIVPFSLLPLVTPEAVHTLISRDACNSFGIWSSLGDGSETSGNHDEFLGYGIWPSASFFNHSCRPTVVMDRIGRALHFQTSSKWPVSGGDELCISYLGLDAQDMHVEERRKALLIGWDFSCACSGCIADIALDV